jgi:four helix bundle protein
MATTAKTPEVERCRYGDPTMEKPTRTYRNLDAWQRGMDIALTTYHVVGKLPASEKYELSSQMRRSAVSVPSNVAEGHERRNKGYLHHLRIALGSVAELETQIELSLRLGFLRPADVESLVAELATEARLLHGLRRSVHKRIIAKAAPTVLFLALLVAL